MNALKHNVNCTCIPQYLSIATHETYIASRIARLKGYPSISVSMRTLVGVCVCVCRRVCVLWMHLSLSLC